MFSICLCEWDRARGLSKPPLIEWINQGLLTVFSFLIGIHTNHELTRGMLSEPGSVLLPASAALGGMIVPFEQPFALDCGVVSSISVPTPDTCFGRPSVTGPALGRPRKPGEHHDEDER